VTNVRYVITSSLINVKLLHVCSFRNPADIPKTVQFCASLIKHVLYV